MKAFVCKSGRILSAPTGLVPRKLAFKPQLCTRSLLEKRQIWEQNASELQRKKQEAGLQELAIQECSRKLIALFLVKKRERERERTFRGTCNLKQVAPGFQGIGRADATRL